jgi:glutathione S-transferase
MTIADFKMYTTLDVYRVLQPTVLDTFPHLKGFVLRFEARRSSSQC